MKTYAIMFFLVLMCMEFAVADGYWQPAGVSGVYYVPVITPAPRIQETRVYVLRDAPPQRITETRRENYADYYSARVTEYYAVDGVVPLVSQIKYAQCSVFTDRSIVLQVYFINNTTTEYRISAPVLRTRENASLFKTTYNVVDKSGPELLFGRLSCDVYANDQDVCQIVIYGRNHSSITINLQRGY